MWTGDADGNDNSAGRRGHCVHRSDGGRNGGCPRQREQAGKGPPAEDIKLAPIDQAAGSLAGALNSYGPENRWRVWNDLRDTGLSLQPAQPLPAEPVKRSA
ncbi:hypothetical protein HMPREF9946_04153 [Acetobacteraceae bacterium AT-5844]|nr:hypothetical protein HMPREF9946_04153 [Acetobacteraceae bacterium AT-5844]